MFIALKTALARIYASVCTSPEQHYLAQSSDLADLERRIRRLERCGGGFTR